MNTISVKKIENKVSIVNSMGRTLKLEEVAFIWPGSRHGFTKISASHRKGLKLLKILMLRKLSLEFPELDLSSVPSISLYLFPSFCFSPFVSVRHSVVHSKIRTSPLRNAEVASNNCVHRLQHESNSSSHSNYRLMDDALYFLLSECTAFVCFYIVDRLFAVLGATGKNMCSCIIY